MMGLEAQAAPTVLQAVGMAPGLSTYEDPYYQQQMAAAQLGLGAMSRPWAEMYYQPRQYTTSTYSSTPAQRRAYQPYTFAGMRV